MIRAKYPPSPRTLFSPQKRERKKEREMHVFHSIFLMMATSVCSFRSLITIRTILAILSIEAKETRAPLNYSVIRASVPFRFRTLINKFEKQAFVLCPEESSIFCFRRATSSVRVLFRRFLLLASDTFM